MIGKQPSQKVNASKQKKERETTDLSYKYWQRLASGELTEGFSLNNNGELTLKIASKWDKPNQRFEIRKCLKRLYDNSMEFRNIFKTPLLKRNKPFLELRNYKRRSNNVESSQFLEELHNKLIEIAKTVPLYDFKTLFKDRQLIVGYHLVARKIVLKIAEPYNHHENYQQIIQMLQNYYFTHNRFSELFCCPKMNYKAPFLSLRDGINLTNSNIIEKIENALKIQPPKEPSNEQPTTTSTHNAGEENEQFDLSQIDDLPELIEDFLFSYNLKRKLNPILTPTQIQALRSLPDQVVEFLIFSPNSPSTSTQTLVTPRNQTRCAM